MCDAVVGKLNRRISNLEGWNLEMHENWKMAIATMKKEIELSDAKYILLKVELSGIAKEIDDHGGEFFLPTAEMDWDYPILRSMLTVKK